MVYNVNIMSDSGWCFAIINGKLAELFFEKTKDKIKFVGHSYVKSEEYRTKREQRMIKENTAKYQFSYKNRKYKNLIKHIKTEELVNLLNEWDPIGVEPKHGGPKDEYNCLLNPILDLLSEGTNDREFSNFLLQELKDHFGIHSQSKNRAIFAKKVLNWWRVNN